MSRKYLKAQPPSCTFKTEADEDKIIWIDKDTPAGKMCEDDLRSLSSDNYTYDYVPEAELSAPADYGDSPAKLALAYFYDAARKREKPIGTYDTIALIIDTQYVRLTRYGRARVDYVGAGQNNTGPFAVGDTVVVAFEYQDVNRPVVVGFRFNPKTAVAAVAAEFYIRFTLNGFTPIRDGYQLKVMYGAAEDAEDAEESNSSVEGEYGLCGPFTGAIHYTYAYAYLHYHITGKPFYYGLFHYFQNVGQAGDWDYHGYLEEKVGSCAIVPDPNYVYRLWSSGSPPAEGNPVFVKRVAWKKHTTNLADITPTTEDGKIIYAVNFELKIMQQKQIDKKLEIENGIIGCGWCQDEPANFSYRAVAPGVLKNDCDSTRITGEFVYEGDTYYKSFLYTKYKNSFTIGGLVIITDQYGLNPVFQSSHYLVDCQCYTAYIYNETLEEVVCSDWESAVLIHNIEIAMVTTPESIVLSGGIGGPS